MSPKRYWLGGSPCAGKSTCAEALSIRHGLPHYKCDDHFSRHLEEGAARGWPISTWLRKATTDEIFCRGHQENVALAVGIFREHFPLVTEDLETIGDVIVEGCVLLPEMLDTARIPRSNAFILVPTETFQREHYAKRAWARERVADSQNPEMAFENWMRRDIEFAQIIAAQADGCGHRCLWVDHSTSPAFLQATVAAHWRLSSDDPA